MSDSRFRQAKLISKRWVSDKVLELVFVPFLPLNFKPGQFISIKIGETMYFRAYSIASDSAETEKFTIIADARHEGRGSNYFRSLKLEDVIDFVGPAGNFILANEAKPNILFLCTGSGIAPFIPMLDSLLSSKYVGNIKLLFGVRTLENLLYHDKLMNYKDSFRSFEFEICVSKPQASTNFFKGRITDYLGDKISSIDMLQDSSMLQVYICGNPRMIEETSSKLIDFGVSEQNIYYEKFTHAAT